VRAFGSLILFLPPFGAATRIYLAEPDGPTAGALLETVAAAGVFVKTIIGGALVSPSIPSCERMTARMA
jgi:hypothetical protein